MRTSLILLASPLLLANAEPIPAPLKAMLDAAIAGGNPAEVATVVKYASQAAPASAEEIKAVAQAWLDARTAPPAERAEAAAAAETRPVWKGRAELGGWATSGNSDTVGVSAALDLAREDPVWRHKARLAADYQASNGKTDRKHFLANYEPNRKFGTRAYGYGAFLFESDHFAGYDQRYSTSLGAGYAAIKAEKATLNLELGPAWRRTAFTDNKTETSFAVRGSLELGWKLTPGITFSQTASAYIEQLNSTASAKTALDAKVIGPLAARLSYAVNYESAPPAGRTTTDKTTRAALVYSF